MEEFFFYIDTYGCKVNQYESEAIREAWERLGGVETGAPDNADYILVNGCAITAKAERDARNAVYRHRRAAPRAHITLTGCAARFFPAFKPRAGAEYAKPDLIVPQERKNLLLEGPKTDLVKPEARIWNIAAYKRSRPVVKIQDGCSQNCAYCVVPQTRGKPVSREPEAIAVECERLAGYGELVLSGVNLRQYKNANGDDFWDLLSFLDAKLAEKFSGKLRLRISSLEPAQLSAKGIKTLLASRLVCPHLHLSLQHGAKSVLRRMRRRLYRPEDILAATEALRERWPRLALGADIIAGFPGESEAELNETLGLIKRLKLTYAHVFPYSARPGSPAASYPGQIPRKEKLARARAIRALVAELKKDFLREQLNLPEILVAVESQKSERDFYRGVNEFYAPCYFNADSPPKTALVRARPIELYADGLAVAPI